MSDYLKDYEGEKILVIGGAGAIGTNLTKTLAEADAAKLVGTEIDNIVENVEILLNDRERYKKMARAASPFGDGKGAQRIVDVLLSWS